MDITRWSIPKSDWLYFLQLKMELYSQKKKRRMKVDCGSCHELLIDKFKFKWKKTGKITKALSSVQFSHSVISDSLRLHGMKHARLPCPLPTPGVYSNSCPLSQWCHPAISSSVIPFFCCLLSFPTSGSFPMNWLFESGGQSIGALILPMNIQDWFPLGWISWISLKF